MTKTNPYGSPKPISQISTRRRRNRSRWAIVGFVLGAKIPVALGVYICYRRSLYLASLPSDEYVSGTPDLAWLSLIFIVGPFCGTIGALSGWIAAGIEWRTMH